ncbi:carbohydrate-binding family 9-like protein [uncultured Tateyamaria sp.]|uniref:carbohydrate-binding family 9-like protein n=1 Tax=uncultured Tateyamaria sp. TaxID=455651 RepID=UPI00260B6328|nr:carbohydrate-binding family 9-like protein [uncultured Tateyamaria sp.]
MTTSPDYVAHKAGTPFEIDGDLSKPVSASAEKSKRFVDMATGGPAFYDTRSACLWDDENLYVAFWVEEPFVSAELTERDDIIFQENDVEIFIDGGDCYYELELNALGTIYEMMFIWRDAYKRGDKFDAPEFDLIDQHAYSFGGDFDRQPESFWDGTHPRGTRWAFRNYDMEGLQVGVQVQGKINDPDHVDKGWTAEIAIPWKSLHWLANGRSLPPKNGDEWKIFFGRFQKLMNAGQEISPHPAWVLKPHGKYDTHQPEQFPVVRFVEG